MNTLAEARRALERKEARLLRQGRTDEAQIAALMVDALWDREHPGSAERREQWQAAQIEQDARNRCPVESDEHAHDPR